MKLTSFSFDFVGLIVLPLVILLMLGVVPFTPFWVGLIILLTQTEFKVTWR